MSDNPQADAVLDEGLICHVGFDDGAGPVVLPGAHARRGDVLYLHVAGSPWPADLAVAGVAVCVTVTLTDGLVLARAQLDHTVNLRSAVVRGVATPVDDPAEKADALAALVDHLLAGRSTHSRVPDAVQLAGLVVLRLPAGHARLTGRSGPPRDDPADAALPHWAGVLGIRPAYGPALPAQDLPYGRQVPAQITNYSRTARPQGYR